MGSNNHSSDEVEVAEYGRYLALLQERAGLRDEVQAKATEIETTGRNSVDVAASSERQIGDAIRQLDRRIDALRPRIRRIAAPAEPLDVGPNLKPKNPGSLDECTSLAQAIEVDLRKAESSWAWIDRQRGQVVAPATMPQVTISPVCSDADAIQTSEGATSPTGARSVPVVLGVAALVIALALLVALVVV